MNERGSHDHDEIAGWLPDYAIGALDDSALWHVSVHLERCRVCQAELTSILESMSIVTLAPPPRPAVRDAVFARIGVTSPPRMVAAPVSAGPWGDTRPLPDAQPLVAGHVPAEQLAERRSTPTPIGRRRDAFRGLALAAMLALVVLAGWNIWLQTQLAGDDTSDRIAAFVTTADVARPLTESDLQGTAGVLYFDPAGDEAVLVASGLPTLTDDQRYQVFLFTPDNERIAVAQFTANEDGTARIFIDTPEPLSAYVAIALSAEPIASGGAPTGQLAVGGWLQ